MSIPSVTSPWSGGGGTSQTNQRPANASLDICMAKYEEYAAPIGADHHPATSKRKFGHLYGKVRGVRRAYWRLDKPQDTVEGLTDHPAASTLGLDTFISQIDTTVAILCFTTPQAIYCPSPLDPLPR
ncbi:hypothetical protein J6590_029559 [Homalodisca vitripennis]|nr:hypothetical protein J6590_029559 [Homalodisca vitripennis]